MLSMLPRLKGLDVQIECPCNHECWGTGQACPECIGAPCWSLRYAPGMQDI